MKRSTMLGLTLGVVGLGVAALALTGHKSVHAELIIPAPPDAVWATITDASSYAAWNPVFVKVEGTYEEGSSMQYAMKDASGQTTDVTSTVVKADPGVELNQFGGIRGVITFDHHWLLEPVEGGTRVTQHEEYRGLGVWFWDPSWYEGAYGRALEGLRDRLTTSAN
ncbi:MAG: SRPBCC family protein [Myxococcota bacterium]